MKLAKKIIGIAIITVMFVNPFLTEQLFAVESSSLEEFSITIDKQVIVAGEIVSITVTDSNLSDTKLFIPITNDIELIQSEKNLGLVHYDTEKSQLVIDWGNAVLENNHINIEMRVGSAGEYSFKAFAIREEATVESQGAYLLVNPEDVVESSSDEDTGMNIEIEDNAEVLDTNKVEENSIFETKITGTWGTSEWSFEEASGVVTIGTGAIGMSRTAPWNTNEDTKIDYKKIKKIEFVEAVIAPTNCTSLFNVIVDGQTVEWTELENIEGLSNLNTSNVENMRSMFYGLRNLMNPDVSSFETKRVVDMNSMFGGASSIDILDVSQFETSQVENMGHMFSGLKVSELNVSSWDTGRVKNMEYMFNGLSNLRELDVSGFKTGQVTKMESMFSGLSSLSNLDVSKFDTKQVDDMYGMFAGVKNVRALDLSSFNTNKVWDMDSMFLYMNLERLTLGNDFRFIGEAGLPVPIAVNETDIVTGKWTSEDQKLEGYSPKDFMANYGTGNLTSGTYVAEVASLSVVAKDADILLGTNIANVNVNDFIKSVKLGVDELPPEEYEAIFVKSPATDKIGRYEVNVKVTLKNYPSKSEEIATNANILWGSTILSTANAMDVELGGRVDTSVSLLHDERGPYLNANQGNGFYEGTTHIVSRPRFSIYRNDTSNGILNADYETVLQLQSDLAERWNMEFDNVTLAYGDVMVYSVNRYDVASLNHNGKNTWISRDNFISRETQGYNEAFYELTTIGYRLLRINQLKVNNSNKVSINTTKEEMNDNIAEYITIPSTIASPENFRMEFESVDTETSGKKTSLIKVHEKLLSGGEFMTTYPVEYEVYPEVLGFYDVPEIITFNEGKIANTTKEIKRKESDWKIVVQDTRKNKGDWRLTAQLLTHFRNSQDNILEDILLYRKEGKKDKIISDVPEEVFDGGKDTLVFTDIKWSDEEGLLLKIAPGIAKLGSYQGEIEWNLISAPV